MCLSNGDGKSCRIRDLQSANGVLNLSIQYTNVSSYTLTAGNTSIGETWNCTVTPWDGYENGTLFE